LQELTGYWLRKNANEGGMGCLTSACPAEIGEKNIYSPQARIYPRLELPQRNNALAPSPEPLINYEMHSAHLRLT